MEQTKTNTPPRPQFIEDINNWHKGDTEHRSILCIATDKEDAHATLAGYSFPLVMAFLVNAISNEVFGEIAKDVYLAKKNPLILDDLLEKWQEFKKEHNWPLTEEEAKTESKSSIKSSLKDLFQTLADKL